MIPVYLFLLSLPAASHVESPVEPSYRFGAKLFLYPSLGSLSNNQGSESFIFYSTNIKNYIHIQRHDLWHSSNLCTIARVTSASINAGRGWGRLPLFVGTGARVAAGIIIRTIISKHRLALALTCTSVKTRAILLFSTTDAPGYHCHALFCCVTVSWDGDSVARDKWRTEF